MKTLMQTIDTAIDPLRSLADKIGAPIFDVLVRSYVAWIFLKSGMGRLDSAMNGSWSDQVFLFTEEHPVPGVPGDIAAILSTGAELILPVLLITGLFGRFAAAGLLVMTAIIEFTYTHSNDHILWAFLLGMVFVRGPGLFSADHVLRGWLRKS